MDFLKDIVKEIGDDYTKLALTSTTQSLMWTRVRTFLTDLFQGLYLVVYLGIRLLPLAGESSTGKTFFSLAVVKNFLDSNPDGYCLYFDTEAAVNKSLLVKSWGRPESGRCCKRCYN